LLSPSASAIFSIASPFQPPFRCTDSDGDSNEHSPLRSPSQIPPTYALLSIYCFSSVLLCNQAY